MGNTETTRINNPFDIYRMEELQKIIAANDLEEFLAQVDPNGAIQKSKIENFSLVRKNNHVHAVPK